MYACVCFNGLVWGELAVMPPCWLLCPRQVSEGRLVGGVCCVVKLYIVSVRMGFNEERVMKTRMGVFLRGSSFGGAWKGVELSVCVLSTTRPLACSPVRELG